ncbi:MAG: hypothetical protein A3G33_00535 [Omnitrophica bacterium RIFCSPLOWO2_12_FULL_44_17]|uniref:PHP domain-containing protein n=1 Tax=Candidatus Danuiimicrobium aquiferis TaxID=1801832 RepID=A0A1G1L0Z7_9BACT|nr:MAG: hypothetical protein A3B72_05565 [Omnitrophica bacterium RIFCSPHIGHO2_02_FULL_45_28]OGW90565.1 MAG: hypothetical protein A3E74_03800 [Omnitrophica bacterium RIFCSPHIGHO2_12_FULL_44_12]OGW98808.1 MAG: hypothetical protein A3G33_00535 [Omnitrophica bacterium RIFCSPLOWO2_12_FULL_44_17]OGX02678.1 MAG: hypothetical protein A3J12_06775 [Omnitrophica bacterium RIFCSPLOWO2_02_FULL_44_11]
MKIRAIRPLLNKITVLSILVTTIFSGCGLIDRRPAFKPPQTLRPNLYRGVFQVHSEFSHDSQANFDRIIKNGDRAGLDFVVITDHSTFEGAEAYRKGKFSEKPLLIFGTELSTSGGNLLVMGVNEVPPDIMDTETQIEWVHQHGGFVVIPHPFSKKKHWTMWGLRSIDGMELFSLSDIWYKNPAAYIFKSVFLFPEDFLKEMIKRPGYALGYWDMMQKKFPIVGFAGLNAHIKLEMFGIPIENLLLYFQSATMYVEAENLTAEKITTALRQGNSFIAFEVNGLANDFQFSARTAQRAYGQGATIDTQPGEAVLFSVMIPFEGRIRCVLNGNIIKDEVAKSLEFRGSEPGFYRVEVERDGRPWILSNPIYLSHKPLPVESKLF